MKDWHLLEFSTPIKENYLVNDEFVIKGTAISETITHNNHKYIAEELEKASSTLINKPLLVDHQNTIESIKGRVKASIFNKSSGSVEFEAQVMDKNIQEMIKDGRINSVSVGAFCEDLVKDDATESYIAKGIKFAELSLVAVPADENATFAMAMTNNYALKESSITDKTGIEVKSERRYGEMEENKIAEMEKANKELSESHQKALEELTILRNERRQNLVNEYKKLCSTKKVKEKDMTNVSEETIKFLIEQLKDIPEEKQMRSQVIEADLNGLDNIVVERSQWVKGTAIWEMPNEEKIRRLHQNLPSNK